MPTTDRNRPATQLLLPPRLFDTAERYAIWAAAADRGISVAIDADARYDKRCKGVHRTTVADVRGELRLTIPVAKPRPAEGAAPRWSDVAISTHDRWWEILWTTLESAYGRTPYFEFYADRFRPFFSASTPEAFSNIAELDIAADSVVADILLLPPPSRLAPDVETPAPGDLPTSCLIADYWQVRADRLGFISGLSILDMIFNIGPESALLIRGKR